MIGNEIRVIWYENYRFFSLIILFTGVKLVGHHSEFFYPYHTSHSDYDF